MRLIKGEITIVTKELSKASIENDWFSCHLTSCTYYGWQLKAETFAKGRCRLNIDIVPVKNSFDDFLLVRSRSKVKIRLNVYEKESYLNESFLNTCLRV